MVDALQGLVDTVVAQSAGLPTPAQLAGWQPALSGDIPIRIRSDGRWEHEGKEIRREELVRLFASLLRRESDGDFYLVTPAEKWRIRVDRHPMQIIDCDPADPVGGIGDGAGEDRGPAWIALLNTGGRCRIGGGNRLYPRGDSGEPYLELASGLSAQFTRAAWYRLVDAAREEGSELVLYSAGERLSLGEI